MATRAKDDPANFSIITLQTPSIGASCRRLLHNLAMGSTVSTDVTEVITTSEDGSIVLTDAFLKSYKQPMPSPFDLAQPIVTASNDTLIKAS
ncbi:Aste57867_23400 [Aphanomyces stellatus]|uniref:Aste57867_23400 protein n=1 Tax=Aphanomyces stellatus TaxID=120398 RepID=A0A485LNM2_9STRA|nr:hypothetical protein As57867_023329 [Aphanomyces stellatus]VFU00046.1 Aste57867_23400 [Aphanomyces stellatus]